jgi:thiol:disulfide interchange protein DsbC
MIVRFLTLLLAATLCTVAVADEASVKKAVEARFTDVKVNSVTRTQYPGLYEVLIGDDVIVYTDEKVTYLFSTSEGGLALIDVKSGRNLTEEKRQKLSAIRFEDLPLDAAIKTVRGTGKRVFATFEDPNCPYCKRLWQDVAKLDNVTIYTFLYPILSPDSEARAKAIWCSKDRSRAWVDHMLTASMPAPAPDCENPIEKNLALGRRLRVSGTPTMFFTSGQRLVGARPDELVKLLDESMK